MTKQEVVELMTILQANYPDSFRGMSDAAVKARVALWHDMFGEYPKAVVQAAAKAFMATDTKGFMPNVGQIMEHIQRIREPEGLTPAEAWQIVYKALKNSGYGAEEEFAKLPREIQRFVRRPEQLKEWAMMDTEIVQSVIGSNFQRSYKVRAEHDRDMDKLPTDVKKFISDFSGSMGMLESGDRSKNGTSGQLGQAELDAIARVMAQPLEDCGEQNGL